MFFVCHDYTIIIFKNIYIGIIYFINLYILNEKRNRETFVLITLIRK